MKSILLLFAILLAQPVNAQVKPFASLRLTPRLNQSDFYAYSSGFDRFYDPSMLYEVSAGVKKGHVHLSTGFAFGNNKLYAVISKQGEAWTVRAKRPFVQIPIRLRADVFNVGPKAKVFTTLGWSYQVLARQPKTELSRNFVEDRNGLITILNPDFYQYYISYNNQTNSHLFNLGVGLEYQFGSNHAFFISPTYEAGTRVLSVYNIFVTSARTNGQTAYIINRATNFGIQTGFSFLFN